MEQGKYLENTKSRQLNGATMLSSNPLNYLSDSKRSTATNDRSRSNSSNYLLEHISRREVVQQRPRSDYIVQTIKRQKKMNGSESAEEDVIEGTPEKSGVS